MLSLAEKAIFCNVIAKQLPLYKGSSIKAENNFFVFGIYGI